MSNVKKRESRNRLLQLQTELDQILAELVEPRQDRFATPKRSLDIQVDVFETEQSIHIRAEMPGIAKEDVKLFLARDMVMIEGEKKSPYCGEKLRFLNLEREFGRFKRDVGIPKPVDGKGIIATMDDGILYVEMKKISDRRGRRKQISID